MKKKKTDVHAKQIRKFPSRKDREHKRPCKLYTYAASTFFAFSFCPLLCLYLSFTSRQCFQERPMYTLDIPPLFLLYSALLLCHSSALLL